MRDGLDRKAMISHKIICSRGAVDVLIQPSLVVNHYA